MNTLVLLGAALIPMVMGFIWYNPAVLGKAWMNAAGMTEEKMKGANMAVIFGLSFVFAIMLSFILHPIVIHQLAVKSIFFYEPESPDLAEFLAKYGDHFRTFKHGALHGTVAGLFIALPVLGTNALFERKNFKYIAINAGYWAVTMALMGGVICQFG
ncbi:MAG: DUF1761 domain-containing protein [Bacteroidia bacterium]|nr:DUF1761 domain-containing protein [Bacteroidia bacterium]